MIVQPSVLLVCSRAHAIVSLSVRHVTSVGSLGLAPVEIKTTARVIVRLILTRCILDVIGVSVRCIYRLTPRASIGFRVHNSARLVGLSPDWVNIKPTNFWWAVSLGCNNRPGLTLSALGLDW